MAEETGILQEQPPVDNITQNLQNVMWGDGTPLPATADTPPADVPPINTDTAASDTPPVETGETLNPNVYLKNKWGWENEEAADTEIKQLRERVSKGYEYKNDESRKVAEYINEGKEEDLYKFLDTKAKVKKLSTADLSDKNAATELVKFGLHNDNPNLLSDEIDFLFNEKYSIPIKPIKGEDEEDVDYDARLGGWEIQKSNIEKRLVIEAKMNQPKLAQLSTELVLPEINKGAAVKQEPTPEELEAFNKTKTTFLQSAKTTIDGFNGFTAQVKDKDVDYSVSYTPSPEEKTFIADKLTKLAESGFDVNELFAERWYDNNTKAFKVDQMTEDLSRIFMGKNSDQKLAVDSANKRMEQFLKEKKNVNVTQGNQGSTFQPNGTQTQSEKLAEKFFA